MLTARQYLVTTSKTKAIAIVVLLHFMFFQTILNIGFLSYFDEIITLLFGLAIIQKKIKNKYFTRLLMVLALFYFIAIISSVISGCVPGFSDALVDSLGFLKWPFTFIGISICFGDKLKRDIIETLAFVGKIMLVTALIFAVINFSHDIGMSFDYRYGFRSFKFIFNNPAALNETNLIYFCAIANKNKKNETRFYFLIFFMCTLFTLRANGLGVLGIYIGLSILYKFEKKLKWRHFVLLGSIGALIGWTQIQGYLLNTTHIRAIMYVNGFKYAKIFFPFGMGFATFGSEQAFRANSIAYQQLNFNMEMFAPYRNDNFWAMILGQFGFLGLICYLGLIVIPLVVILKSKMNKNDKKLSILCWSEMFISSLGNAIYTSVGSVLIFGLIALMGHYDDGGILRDASGGDNNYSK